MSKVLRPKSSSRSRFQQFRYVYSSKAAAQRCSVKQMFLRFSQNSQKNTCARASLLKRRLWQRCFPANFAKFLRTSFFTEQLRWLLLIPQCFTKFFSQEILLKLRSSSYINLGGKSKILFQHILQVECFRFLIVLIDSLTVSPKLLLR